MNLLSHLEATRRVSPVTKLRVLNYFGLPFLRGNLVALLHDEGLCQADLVLCLLRVGGGDREARALISRLIGHDIVVCPPCLRGWRRPPPERPKKGELVVTWVGRNKFLNGTDRNLRFGLLRPGMTLSQYKSRGGRRRDLRAALRNGTIRVKEAA